jgi:hypothetical protein
MNLQAGNFKQPMPGELMLGRFSPLAPLLGLTDGAMPDAAANWLYGGSNTWNGAALDGREIPWAPAFGVSAFGHVRPAETGFGGGAYARAGRQAKVFFGLTGFALGADGGAGNNISGTNDIGDSNDVDGDYGMDAGDGIGNVGNHQTTVTAERYYAAHLYGEYKAKAWRVASEAALPLDGGVVPALSLRINYRINESSAEYHVMAYPSGFAAPMSRVKKQILAEIGVKGPPQSPRSPSIQKHALRMAVPLVDYGKDNSVKLIPEIDFTESGGGVRRVHGRAEARARFMGAADIAVRHASKFFADGADSILHTSGASVNVLLHYPLEIRAALQSVYGYYKNARNTYTLELPCTMLPGAVIAPYIKGKYVLANEYSIGVRSEFYLSKKTWTGVTLEIPINIKGDGNVYIKGSSSYAF